jgi:hypothetical protein
MIFDYYNVFNDRKIISLKKNNFIY